MCRVMTCPDGIRASVWQSYNRTFGVSESADGLPPENRLPGIVGGSLKLDSDSVDGCVMNGVMEG